MDRDSMLGYLNDRPGAVEDYPFGDDVAVFKVGGRVFAICDLTGQPGSISLKCDPTLAEALRDRIRPSPPGTI
jgi:predicted DNA-binding protein (MmcQ/YjbR family)